MRSERAQQRCFSSSQFPALSNPIIMALLGKYYNDCDFSFPLHVFAVRSRQSTKKLTYLLVLQIVNRNYYLLFRLPIKTQISSLLKVASYV